VTEGNEVQSLEFDFHEIGADHCASQFRCYSVDLVRRLPKDILHTIVSSPSLELESEDDFVRILIEHGKDYLEFFDYIEVNYLTKEYITLFLDQLTFDDLTQSIWTKLVDRLKRSKGQSLRSNRYHRSIESPQYRRSIESKIINSCPGILNEFSDQEWSLLYRGSTDGF
jgi:hypothetical protein